MNYQQVRAFHFVAKHGSVTAAARQLNVSQPTLSKQIRDLAAQRGARLFERAGRRLVLTPAGADLFRITERLMISVDAVDQLLQAATSIEHGTLKIGTDGPQHGAALLAMMRARYPEATLSLAMGNAADMHQRLVQGAVDVALLSDPPADPRLYQQVIGPDPLLFVLPAAHPWASQREIPLEALRGETLLQREAASRTRLLVERALDRRDIQPNAVIEIDGREAIREAIARAIGVSLIAASESPPDPRLALRRVAANGGESAPQMHVFATCLIERRRVPIVREVLKLAESYRDDWCRRMRLDDGG